MMNLPDADKLKEINELGETSAHVFTALAASTAAILLMKKRVKKKKKTKKPTLDVTQLGKEFDQIVDLLNSLVLSLTTLLQAELDYAQFFSQDYLKTRSNLTVLVKVVDNGLVKYVFAATSSSNRAGECIGIRVGTGCCAHMYGRLARCSWWNPC